jgi:N-acetylglucosaminyldiphosphoundecaprenol N-acetyl-beta-D-mannosaminyltransferase
VVTVAATAERAAPSARPLRILGTGIDLMPASDVLARVAGAPPSAGWQLAFVNAHSLNLAHEDREFRAVLARCRLVLNDGIGVKLAAAMRGVRIDENLNGSDFTWRVLTVAAANGWRVFLYGGRPGVGASAAGRLRDEIEGLEIAGVLDGYRPLSGEQVADSVLRARADMVIVALGQPLQEAWLDRHLPQTGCRLGIGVGAFLDFTAGRVPRAPEWMNRAGIEWVYRLAQEPDRLWRRYVIGNPRFLWHAWWARRRERRADAEGW